MYYTQRDRDGGKRRTTMRKETKRESRGGKEKNPGRKQVYKKTQK
jgi:hypothetical protein